MVPGYYTHVVTDMSLDWLKQRDSSRPFFLMIGQKAPHSFYVPEPAFAEAFAAVDVTYPESAFQLGDKPEWFQKRLNTWHGIYGPLFDFRKEFPNREPAAVKDFAAMTRAYWATILSVDQSVGKICNYLKEAGIFDETIFVFAGDNGLLNGEHGMVDKRTMHEPSIRVPLVVRFPGLTPAAQPKVVREQVLHVDLAPSLLDLCGVPALRKTHGKSWKKLVLEGDPAWRKAWHYEYNYEAQFPYTPNIRGVRTDEWKLIRYPHGDGSPDKHLSELYRISDDPLESRNLIRDPQYKEVVQTLQTELDRLIRETDGLPDQMPVDDGILDRLPESKIR